MLRLHQTELAKREFLAASDYYAQISPQVLRNYLQCLSQVFKQIKAFPYMGLNRYTNELKMAGLRHWSLRGFPYTLVYQVFQDRVLIVRCLHTASDIPASLQADDFINDLQSPPYSLD